MAALGQIVSVGNTATLIYQVVDGVTYSTLTSPGTNVFKSGTPNDPIPLLIVFPATATVYCGGSGVTSGTGVLMPAGYTFIYNVVGGDSLYGITASGSQNVQILALRQ